MVSILLGVWNGGGGAAGVLPSAVVRLVPYSSHRGAGEYCRHVVHCFLPGVRCGVGVRPSVVFVWWGILCPLPPHVGGGWGRRGWWGAVVVVGGMASEGRLCCWPSRLARWCPPPVCVVVSLKGGSGVCCAAPCSDWVWHLELSVPLHIVCSPRIVPVPLLSCVAVFVVGGEVRWGTVPSSTLLSLCLLSQHCWFSLVLL